MGEFNKREREKNKVIKKSYILISVSLSKSNECIECVQLCEHFSTVRTLCNSLHLNEGIWFVWWGCRVSWTSVTLHYHLKVNSMSWVWFNGYIAHHIASANCQRYRWCFSKDWLNRKRKKPVTNWNNRSDSCASLTHCLLIFFEIEFDCV